MHDDPPTLQIDPWAQVAQEAGRGDLRVEAPTAASGRTVVLVHGFPDVPETWLPAARLLALDGDAVYLVRLPGYGGREDGRWPLDALTLPRLSAALGRTIAEALPHDARVTLVAHDWGAALGWAVVADPPPNLERAYLLSVPAPAVLWRTLVRRPWALWRSWYMLVMQAGGSHERRLMGRWIDLLWARWSPHARGERPWLTHTARERVIDTLRATAPAASAYYRNLRLPSVQRWLKVCRGGPRVATLVVHGDHDGCIPVALAQATQRLVRSDDRYRMTSVAIVHGGGHFLHVDSEARLLALLTGH